MTAMNKEGATYISLVICFSLLDLKSLKSLS